MFGPIRKLFSFPLQAPTEVKLHTGQAAGLSNGVNLINIGGLRYVGLYGEGEGSLSKPEECG